MTATKTKKKPAKKLDKYDRAMAYLRSYPSEIRQAWWHPADHAAGALFRFATPSGRAEEIPSGGYCGCLTTIRLGENVAWTDELTDAIRRDKRLPESHLSIEPRHLPRFAMWQRRLDKELNRA